MHNILKGRLLFVRLCLIAATAALVAVGVLTIYSAGNPAEPTEAAKTNELANYWKKQVVFAVIAAAAFVAANLFNYRRLGALSYGAYAIVLLLLVVLLIGRYVVALPFVQPRNATHRWIQFTIAGRPLPALQPSEICKLAYILALAWYLRYRSNYRSFNALLGPFVLTVVPMVLILLEPDLGTVLLMMPILITMLFVAGAKVKHFLIVVLLAILISPLLWHRMEPYQRIRIASLVLQNKWVREKAENHTWLGKVLVGEKFSEKKWKNTWGWHLIRAKYAVASGGPQGYGFRRGPFIKYDFLKERHNDFIFATIAHQWGFRGCLVLFGLYVIIVGCALEIAAHNTDPFGRLLVIGIIAMFVVEVVVNVSMTVGLMPITGLTLPFVSYGGSSLLVSVAAIGLLNNVGRCRPFTVAPKPFG